LDTISAGATIAFAMEAFEKGLLSLQDTDGIDLSWGNAEALIAVIHKMGQREGIGELMSQGSKAMAQSLGRNAVEFAVHVKGLEPSAHDPRRFFSQAVSYCTAARGACHNASWSHAYEMALTMPELGIDEPQDPFKIEGKADFTVILQNYNAANDCLIMCRFAQIGRAVTISDIAQWLGMIAGRTVEPAEIMQIGERVFNLKRLYNTRLGISRKDDMLPPRFLTLNRKADDLPNQLPPIGHLLSDYYECRDWTEEGIPSPEKLAELGLDQL
jgi:aldehyde:ferredoxin oxidoreductase